MDKITFQVNKDIADHPHFHKDFLSLVVSYEIQKEIICADCGHSKFEHVIGKNGNKYCRTCQEQDIN